MKSFMMKDLRSLCCFLDKYCILLLIIEDGQAPAEGSLTSGISEACYIQKPKNFGFMNIIY